MNSSITPIYEIREKILRLYAEHTRIIESVFKFIAAFIMITGINTYTGYVTIITTLPVVLIMSLICILLPWSCFTPFMFVLIFIHYLKLSVLVAGVIFCFLLIMFFADIIFAPGLQCVVFITMIMFFLKLPFLVPIILGLIAPVTSIVPMFFGVMFYYIIDYISGTAGVLADATEAAGIYAKYYQLINGIKDNHIFWIIAASFIITVLIVHLIHRKPIDYAWTIAIVAGTVTDMVLILFGVASARINSISIITIIICSIISGIIAFIMQFMFFAVDYKRTELVQFEDDDYYYFVKAIPKVKVPDSGYDKIDLTDNE